MCGVVHDVLAVFVFFVYPIMKDITLPYIAFWSSCYYDSIMHLYMYHHILYFAWEGQSDLVYCIFHTVLINCITVLYLPN